MHACCCMITTVYGLPQVHTCRLRLANTSWPLWMTLMIRMKWICGILTPLIWGQLYKIDLASAAPQPDIVREGFS